MSLKELHEGIAFGPSSHKVFMDMLRDKKLPGWFAFAESAKAVCLASLKGARIIGDEIT